MNWNYIAGFFDGEGTVNRCENDRYKIGITQTNKAVLEEIQQFSGLGYIHRIKKRKSHWKDAWLYYISKQEDVYKFLSRISNKSIVKRKTIIKILPELKGKIERMKKQKIKIVERKRVAKHLREIGFSYRKIGKKLRIDWGYARRLILNLKGPKV